MTTDSSCASASSRFDGVVCTATLVLLAVAIGYAFPHPDHSSVWPQVQHLLKPAMYPGDFFVSEMSRFSPRTYFNYMLLVLTKSVHGSLQAGFFALYVLIAAIALSGLWKLGRAATRTKFGAGLVVFWGVTLSLGTLGRSALFTPTPLPYVLGSAASIWGVYFAFRGEWLRAFSAFGLASLSQFLVGILPALLCLPLYIDDGLKDEPWRAKAFVSLSRLVPLIVGIAAVYVPLRLTGATGSGALSSTEFIDVYANARHPHHLVSSTWGATHWLGFAVFYLGIVLIAKSSRLSTRLSLFVRTAIAVMLCGLAANYLFVEVWPIDTIAKLQFARFTPFVGLISLLLLARYTESLADPPLVLLVPLVVFAPVVSGGSFIVLGLALVAFFRDSRKEFPAGARRVSGLLLGAAFGITVSTLIVAPLQDPRYGVIMAGHALLLLICLLPGLLEMSLQGARGGRVLAGGALLVVAIGMFGFPATEWDGEVGAPNLSLEFRNRSEMQIALAVRANTPRNACIVIPPHLHSFRAVSERCVYVNFKNFPYTDRGIGLWRERMTSVLGSDLTRLRGFRTPFEELYSSRPYLALERLGHDVGAEYVLTRAEWHDVDSRFVALASGAWLLVRISTPTKTHDSIW